MSTPPGPVAAASFRHFFTELREAFLERETLLSQIELALLCREHVLVVGPPGTAKSAVASAVLARILDARTGAPSLFSKQLSESTMQADLIGPVDFKVLTETGRTEHITDDGMLGATHAFLDEVFDGRDMLLRSILNVLHERELKHGRKVTVGKIECAIMTSNRYLSEVVARSPELLWAFADRLSFVCFVPKGFARPESRAAMLTRANRGQRMEFKAGLTLQELDVLQSMVEQVQVPPQLVELLEALTDELERTLSAQATRLPDYVPTKSFSQRSVVKALWALKGGVVRDAVWHRPHRPLVASESDLESLRSFFVLGGPPAEDVERLLRTVVDARERHQLESIRFEQRAFDEALKKILQAGTPGADKEAELLQTGETVTAAESLSRSFQADAFEALVKRLRARLSPGPRHPENREPLLSAARLLLSALSRQLVDGQSLEGDLGSGQALSRAAISALQLAELIPELRERRLPLADQAQHFVLASFALAAASAEGRAFERQGGYDSLLAFTQEARDQLNVFAELSAQVASLRPEVREALGTAENRARAKIVTAVHQSSIELLRPSGHLDSPALFLAQSRKLSVLDRALLELGSLPPTLAPIRETLLTPISREFLASALRANKDGSVEAFARSVEGLLESIRREGLRAEDALLACRDQVNAWLTRWVSAAPAPSFRPPGLDKVRAGACYSDYHDQFAELPLGSALAAVEALDSSAGAQVSLVEAELRSAVARLELGAARVRGEYVRAWFEGLVAKRPLPEAGGDFSVEEAEVAVGELVRSRLAVLVLREGELIRVAAALGGMETRAPAIAEEARGLRGEIERLQGEISAYCQAVLQGRARGLADDERAA